MNTDLIEEHLNLRNEALFCFIDKATALSTACLTLTITFRRSLVDIGDGPRWLLVASWVGFAAAALFGTMLHLGKVIGYGKMAAQFIDGADEAVGDPGWTFPTMFIIVAMGFVCGISALTAYAIFEIY